MHLKLSCWNVNSARVRKDQILQYLKQYQPDYLLLQELKLTEEDFFQDALLELGYHSHVQGQKTYNGVAILTKRSEVNIEATALPLLSQDDPEDPQARFLHIKDRTTGYHIINIYLPNGNPVFNEDGSFHEKFTYKLNWMERLYIYLKALMQQTDKIIIAGDWNIAPFDQDVYDLSAMQDDALIQPQSRAAYFKIIHLGFTDALKQQNHNAHYTWWDYRGGGFKRDHGMRIDHILLSASLADQLIHAEIHKEYRALEQPSDHAPIYIELTL